MNMKNKIKELNLNKNIEIKDIPEIDLYMDQVIQLFESKLDGYKRNDDEKIMTKTMINNYVKGKLLMNVNKKKYTKEHIILISLIYQLKGGLSISDIKKIIESGTIEIESYKVEDVEILYNEYLKMNENNINSFEKEILEMETMLNKDNSNNELLMVSALINKANMYRKLAEKIIDDMPEK